MCSSNEHEGMLFDIIVFLAFRNIIAISNRKKYTNGKIYVKKYYKDFCDIRIWYFVDN